MIHAWKIHPTNKDKTNYDQNIGDPLEQFKQGRVHKYILFKLVAEIPEIKCLQNVSLI